MTGEAETLLPPNTMRLALILFLTSLVSALISGFIDYQHTQDAFGRQVIIVVTALFVVPYSIIFTYIMKRRNWARLVWLALFILGTLFMLFNHHQVQYSHMSLRYFAMLQSLLQVMITVSLFLPASNRWFKIPATHH